MTPALEGRNLDTFYGQSHILRGVSFRVMPRETVSLLGRNGMGKTTLLRTLIGLVRPRSGEIFLNGEPVTATRASARARRGLALVPENRGVFPNLTVEENLTFAARPGRAGREWTRERVYGLFPRLAERRRQWGNELSGGEQQMLTIGRALMTNPEIILLDEATEGLAPKLRDEIWATLKEIAKAGIAAVVVDKNLADLLEFCDRHVVMAKGEIVFDGSGKALAADQALIHRHLGV
ncbi:MAG TPA: ABC transporter ATP-binding protein [Xanthobacteraceae bacterium]|nr:ABC transporter ATP-binding protein [Xanthobacteraceae bacterium]